MLEPTSDLHESLTPSRPELSRGHPYQLMAKVAAKLASDLELAALRCESSAERRRLRTLSAATAQIAGCLSHSGVKIL